MMTLSAFLGSAPLSYRIQEQWLHFVDIQVSIYLFQPVLTTIVIKQLDSFLEKDIQSFLYRFSNIIRALIQLTSIYVTHTCHLWWAGVNVINVLVRSTDI